MGASDAIWGVVKNLAEAPIIKAHLDAMDRHIKAVEAEARSSERKLTDALEENASLKTKMGELEEKLAHTLIHDEYEWRGELYYKKGEEQPRCPHCLRYANRAGSVTECPKCQWRNEFRGLTYGTLPGRPRRH